MHMNTFLSIDVFATGTHKCVRTHMNSVSLAWQVNRTLILTCRRQPQHQFLSQTTGRWTGLNTVLPVEHQTNAHARKLNMDTLKINKHKTEIRHMTILKKLCYLLRKDSQKFFFCPAKSTDRKHIFRIQIICEPKMNDVSCIRFAIKRIKIIPGNFMHKHNALPMVIQEHYIYNATIIYAFTLLKSY